MDNRIANNKLDLSKEMIITSYKNGSTLKDLSGAYSCAPNSIRNLLKKNGIDLRSRGRKKNGKAEAAVDTVQD